MEIVTLDELKFLPLWRTRLKVVIEHTYIDDEYIESYEGCLGNMSYGMGGGLFTEFSVSIGGKGWGGEGRWVSVKSEHHRKVTVFLL